MVKTEIIRIGRDETAWHDRFFRHAADIFGGIDFRRWAALGGWGENYHVMAVVEGDELLATVGVSCMQFTCAGDADDAPGIGLTKGVQLGAVATRHDQRGMGHARRLMDTVLASADASGAPVLLFANASVVDFYPKFGFRKWVPQRLSLEVALLPYDVPARRLDPDLAADRALLNRLCISTPPHGGALSARPEPSILLWYLCNGLTTAYIIENGHSVVFVEQAGDRLFLQEWIGAPPADLPMVLPSVVSTPVKTVELGFLPPQSWLPQPVLIEDDRNALMFWRGNELPGHTLCFPALLQT